LTRLLSLAQVRLAALCREDGQGTTEYALLLVGIVGLAGLVALIVVPGVTNIFNSIPGF
jgi:Flp pilus assembly pilin Flp